MIILYLNTFENEIHFCLAPTAGFFRTLPLPWMFLYLHSRKSGLATGGNGETPASKALGKGERSLVPGTLSLLVHPPVVLETSQRARRYQRYERSAVLCLFV